MADKFSKEEKIISDLLQSLGEWSQEIVIGGGYALLIYRLFLTPEREPMPAATRDIDSLIPRSVGKGKEQLAKILQQAGFQHQFKDGENPPTESYQKEMEGEDIELEFLTDDRVRKDRGVNVKISGIVAQPLSYLEMSLSEVCDFETKTGQKGKVVSPAAWAFHKALTFPRRHNDAKQKKDLYGIWFVLSQLGKLSEEAETEFMRLQTENPSWAKTAKKNLVQLKDWSPIDWETLEEQDPAGLLTKQRFIANLTKAQLLG